MSVRRCGVAAVAAVLLSSVSAQAQDAPSNAELFRMLKEQQKTISDLRSELRQARDEQRTTRASVRREVETAKTVARETGREAAKEAMAAVAPGQGSPVYKGPALPPAPNRFTVTGEYLALRAGVGDTGFVLNSPTTSATPQGALVNNDPDFKSAFRVGVGYEFGGSNRAINAYYTHLSETQTKNISGNFLWATVGRADLASAFENYAGTASSSISIKHDRFDLLFSEPVKWFDARVAMLYGLEYARINVDDNYTYVGATTGTVANSSRYSGVGPQLGVSIDHDIFRNSSAMPGTLSVNAVATGSLLYGTHKVAQSQTVGGVTLLNVSDDDTKRVIPVVHLRAGLTHTFPIMSYVGAISLGYEFNSYIGAISRGLWQDDVADGLTTKKFENFDTSGPYANLKVKF
jgi:hypothetical protein